MFYPKHYNSRSQDLGKLSDAGQFYWGATDVA